jgi:hypothetical protein
VPRPPLASLALAVLAGVLAGCTDEPTIGSRPAAIVYGNDDRTDVYAHPNASLRELATQSIVGLVPTSALSDNGDGTWDLAPGPTLGVELGLCADQRFFTQPISASCSGTLVAPDVIVTAGHCMESEGQCAAASFVFDYLYTAEGVLAELEDDDVYRCAEILAQENGVLDYAYVRLDRPVVGHSPATLSRGIGETCRNVEDGAEVSVLGFGSGLPLKIDDGGEVLDASTALSYFFETSLDTFGGNSGSGVFNEAGDLVGVLSAGRTDYTVRAGEDCVEVNVLPESEGGEVIGHVLPTLGAYCDNAPSPDAELCALFDAACPNGVDGDDDPEPREEGSSCSVNAPASGPGAASLAFVTLLGLVVTRRVRRHRGASQ